MLRKLLITPKVPKGTFTCPGTYFDKRTRKHVYLVDGGKKVVNEYEFDDYAKQFDLQIENGHTHMVEYEDEIPSEMQVLDFYLHHPFCQCSQVENPNLVNNLFTVVMQHKVVDEEVGKMNKNLDLAMKVLALSYEEKYDLAFSLGIDARALTHKELIARLVGCNLTGDAITSASSTEHFLTLVDSDRKVNVYVNKAISAGIIINDNGYYRSGSRTLGSQVRDVIDACSADKDFFYGYLVVEVDKLVSGVIEAKDDMTESDLTSVVQEKVKSVRKARAKKDSALEDLTI